ncbi:transposase [Streptomyces avermitilis]|uniref:Insertion element IS402-like domain-containing protein n=1 Tax=Streptomyces avermitilis TaxID=33903 RepID=A0A4D4MHS7_STRAX|nr:transposase [Streptomyces avermitilis]OOV13031.1 transposase [Streptomyces avermitilis]GDY68367.1 hypothetical protein SAV14893_077600 [Streptomyces avermitilis]GDY71264.1 hypothetical protein SAV31267_007490 [Streptomyces avermitilis]
MTGDLTDEQRAWLERLLPPMPKMGPPPRDRRQVFDGIRWRARPGSPWRDIPGRYGPRETAYTLSRRWQMYGTWGSDLKKVQVEADADGHIEWEVSVEAGQRADAPVFTEGQAQRECRVGLSATTTDQRSGCWAPRLGCVTRRAAARASPAK